jgi:hypothetical protein
MFNPLKLAAIFNSATKVSIFSIDPFNISISFNSGTFDFFSQNALNSYSGEPSTVISAKSGRIPTKTGKLFFSLFFFFYDFCEPKLVKEDLLGREHGVGEEGSPDSGKFVGFQPVF